MPSRFEPCGLNQMYSLRYGTVPIVRATGGLADTVTDADDNALGDGRATGFLIHESTADALLNAVRRALWLANERPEQWRALQLKGMSLDLSWQASARRYEEFYAEALAAAFTPA
jgi:starch synthase